MAKDYINYKRIKKLSKGDRDIPLANKALKLSEEVGEFSQAMLKLLGSKNVSKSADVDNPRELVLEELMDCTNVIVDIVNALGFSSKECKEMFEKKLDKWEAKMKRN